MPEELALAVTRAFDAYQRARPEIGASRGDDAVWEAAIWAYDLESTFRGYAQRIEHGQTPQAGWLATVEGAYRFYTAGDYPEAHARMLQTWPWIADYVAAVRALEAVMLKVLRT